MHRRVPIAVPSPFPLLGLLLAALLFTGCFGGKHVLEFDPKFSYNVVKTPAWFPPKKEPLTEAQNEVLFRRGAPDLIRFWWRDDGTLITSSDLTGMDSEKLGEKFGTMNRSWIYMKDKIEVQFSKNGRSYEDKPLDEVLEIVCSYGDPSSRTQPQTINGARRETLQWIERGLQVTLEDGKITDKSYFPGTGQGTWGLK